MQRILGFTYPDSNGKDIFYKYLVMPFGISPAVWVVIQLTTPVVDHIRKKLGVVLVVYIDDFIVLISDKTKEEADEIFLKVVEELEFFGFQVSF